jgi:putative redox protein
MAEQVIVDQSSDFEIEFRASDPRETESEDFHVVHHVHDLTPYGMMLASLGACTTIVLQTYSQQHGVELDRVTIHLRYARVFQQDCENCEDIDQYEEQLQEEITLMGDLTDQERGKLYDIAQQCSIQKILESGIEIDSKLANGS